MPDTTPASAPILITMGDVCGIGPEIIAKAWLQAPQELADCAVVGDALAWRRAMQAVRPTLPSAVPAPVAVLSDGGQLPQVPSGCLPLLQPHAPLPPLPWGQIRPEAGVVAARWVEWAARAALRGQARAIVTAPLHKEALHQAGAPYDRFPGHTELLQHLSAQHLGVDPGQLPVRMMLASPELRTVLVSIHVSLRQALDAVTVANVQQTLHITHHALQRMLGRPPRIWVAGVNPHAGEGGLFGDEERTVVQPAIQAARAQGMDVHGPFPPDTVFMQARRSQQGAQPVDVVIAMYHDQGLIPVKYLGVEEGINVTLGLPLVRTSPDHGTAFDIAGTGRADPSSLLAALRAARQLSAARHSG
ncbi:MAG: 4-hydroxythreonine-4-phosphate dehydrogenase PdxA [Rhodoferax sp.]